MDLRARRDAEGEEGARHGREEHVRRGRRGGRLHVHLQGTRRVEWREVRGQARTVLEACRCGGGVQVVVG